MLADQSSIEQRELKIWFSHLSSAWIFISEILDIACILFHFYFPSNWSKNVVNTRGSLPAIYSTLKTP
ncbi:MAG: hypothetical protein MjAS7_2778 [Metallosphaera javensis (ex Sakai et al. 2022)]|nr:MAG: hypothetical protein MjAS7_2778 [Metallosphaera javensis (ex Sakai et al. 2022)]